MVKPNNEDLARYLIGAWVFEKRFSSKTMSHQVARNYPEQFVTTPDLLHVVIPRVEIIAEMTVRGEHETLNDVCLAVAIVADIIGCAMERSSEI